MLNLKSDWQWGRASNYPVCCILHFLVRQVFIWIAPANVVNRYFEHQRYRWEVLKENEDFQHIPCHYHLFLNKHMNYKPIYFHCKSHNWVQYGNGSRCSPILNRQLIECELVIIDKTKPVNRHRM